MGTGLLRARSLLRYGVLLPLAVAIALAAEPLTNEIIIKMVQSGVPTETIVRTIYSAESFHFGTLPGDLIQLQEAKVPEEIIRALAARINWPGTSWRIVVPVQVAPSAPAAAEKPAKPEKQAKPEKPARPAKAPKIDALAKPQAPVALLAGLEPVAPAQADAQRRHGAVRVAFQTIWNTCSSAVRSFAHLFQ